MPVYEYECKYCGKRFDKMQSITADPLTECLICGGGPIRRVLQPVGVIFKGSGWYSTDSKKSSPTPSSDAANAGKTEGSPTGSSDSSETKTSDSQNKPDTPSS